MGRGMSDIKLSVAHVRAQGRLLAADCRIFKAFDNLGLDFDHEDVLDYLEGAPGFLAFPESQRGYVAGLVMGFALTVAEEAWRDEESP